MIPLRLRAALSGLVLFSLIPIVSTAGNNAGGSAFLSWHRSGVDTVLTSVPSTTFPLFLHLRAAPDVRALATRIIWTTRTVDPPCYSVVSAAEPDATTLPDSLYGWSFDSPPGQDFGDDTTYTWTISFPSTAGSKDCVEYLVSGAACAETTHAEFYAASVLVMDAAGAIDSLEVTGRSVVAPRLGPLVAIDEVAPQLLSCSEVTDLQIAGHGFELGTRVFVQRDGQRIEASEVGVTDSTALRARVVSRFAPGEAIDLVVEYPASGDEAILRASLAAVGGMSAQPGLRPTNDAFAFSPIDLHDPARTASEFPLIPVQHVTHPWPAYLDSPNLLVVRAPGDTAALISSQPYNGIGLFRGINGWPAWVRYPIDPPIYATSVGTLLQGGNLFDGPPPNLADAGSRLTQGWVTYEDGSIAHLFWTVGSQVRNWSSGAPVCGGATVPFYDLPPSDPLAVPLDLTSGTLHYDFQEFRLPADLRDRRITEILFQHAAMERAGACREQPTSALFGATLWPQFKVENAQGDTVAWQSQATGAQHGGYLFGNQPVGTRRLTNETACQVASMAMCYTYAGFPCTVDSLNAHLQRNRGYLPSNVCIVTWVSPTGDTIRYRPYTQDDTRLRKRDRFLVERGNYDNPLATFEVTDTTLRRAVLVPPRHNPATTVVEGDKGRVYWIMNHKKADGYTQNPHLESKQVGASPGLAARVESLLVRNIPVQLNLKTHGHFVVADGWLPSFRPNGEARGTYSIKDPYEPRNFTRLIESRLMPGRPQPKVADYGNQFRLARWVEPAPDPAPTAAAAVASTGVPGLSVLTNGTRRMELVDPLGRRMLRDAGTDEDIAEIPDAWVMDVGSEHDDGDDWDDRQTGYQLDVAEAVDGHYVLHIYADAGHAVNVSAYDDAGVFSTDAAGDTAVVPVGASYDLHYSATARTVAVSHLGSLGVEPSVTTQHRVRLGVGRNPATGPVEFVLTEPADVGDVVDVFDPSGRRVGVVRVSPGDRAVHWDWLDGPHRAGVYLARLRSGSAPLRFVILR